MSVSGHALAGPWIGPVNITNYYMWTHSAAYIRTSAANQDPEGCGNSQQMYLDTSHAQFKTVWAMIMTAYATGSPVSVNVDGCVAGRPLVRAVAVPEIWN